MANMGYCDGNRTNYYFVPLGEVSNLSAGEHTITIRGVANDMKLGRLSIFGVPATVDEHQGNYVEPEPLPVYEPIGNPIEFLASNATLTEGKLDSGKLKGELTWTVNNSTLTNGKYRVSLTARMSSGSHGSETLMDHNDSSLPTYTIFVNDQGYGPTL